MLRQLNQQAHEDDCRGQTDGKNYFIDDLLVYSGLWSVWKDDIQGTLNLLHRALSSWCITFISASASLSFLRCLLLLNAINQIMYYFYQVVIAVIGFFECLFANGFDGLFWEFELLGFGIGREVGITLTGDVSSIKVIVNLPEQILQGKVNESGAILLEE